MKKTARDMNSQIKMKENKYKNKYLRNVKKVLQKAYQQKAL